MWIGAHTATSAPGSEGRDDPCSGPSPGSTTISIPVRGEASPHAHLASLASADRELQAEGGVPARIGPKRRVLSLRWLSGFLHFRYGYGS